MSDIVGGEGPCDADCTRRRMTGWRMNPVAEVDIVATRGSVATIDEYIAGFPPEVQETLRTLRRVIREAAPEAEEKISYQMPTFAQHGNLVHFAAFEHHVGFYPTPSGIEAFKDDLATYKGAKGSVQFPMDKPLPYELIGRIVRFRVAENERQAEGKRRKR